MFEVIDLSFQGEPKLIASYALRGPQGVVLVETGPGSTVERLLSELDARGIPLSDVTDILLTHIHLDHAGAAGRMARETGATIHVHHVGAPHMADPSRLLASASRIYGDLMEPLWGEFLAVPPEQLHALDDNDVVEAGGLRFTALDTPGHAYHHMAYLLDGVCFAGDVAATRLPGCAHVRLPTPPPEINIPAWHESVDRLRRLRPDRLLLTHFGPVEEDVQTHLDRVDANLDAYADFFRPRWQAGEAIGDMTRAFKQWIEEQARADGCDAETVQRLEVVVPSYMQATGIVRYLNKFEKDAS